MIDLTPLDVRKKRGDFGKGLRGYDTDEVDTFLEIVAERMEVLVKENLSFRRKLGELSEKFDVLERREKAVQDALVTAQELRRDVKEQAQREAKVLEHEAQARIAAMIAEAGRVLSQRRAVLEELERQRDRFLKSFRTFLERELDTVEVEFGRAPLEHVTVDLELGKSAWSIEPDEDDDGQDDDDEDDDDEDDDDEDVGGWDGDDEGGDDKDDDGADVSRGDHEEADDRAAIEGQPMVASDSAEDAGIVGPADDSPTSGSDTGEALNGSTEVDERWHPEGSEGEDSLWLSSIMSDREDKDAR